MPAEKRRPFPLSRLGEQALIRRIARACRPLRSPHYTVETGLGDDAFVAKLSSPARLAVTTDTMLEGTHFRLDWNPRRTHGLSLWRSVGHKAMASNLSDLAAMGKVQPLFAFVTLGLHGDISVDNVDNLYKGMNYWTRLFRFSIVGGDIIRSEKSFVSITLVGKKLSPARLERSGARPGDWLLASGPLGLSYAGLLSLQSKRFFPEGLGRRLAAAHLFPIPCMGLGALLSNKATLATSVMDTSDDLRTSVETLARASRVGFDLELGRIPLHPDLRSAARILGRPAEALFLEGGEDYELLFTAPPDRARAILKMQPDAYVLGRATTPKRGLRIFRGGRPLRLEDRRFLHF